MQFTDILMGTLLSIVTIAGLGCAAGLFVAMKNFYANLFLNSLNKRHGRAYFIISGEPSMVEIARQIVIGTIERIEAEQRTKQAEGIKLNDQENPAKEEGTTQ